MDRRSHGLSRTCGVLGAAWALAASGAQVMISDVDVRTLAVGSQIRVPITVDGLTPGTFAGFQLGLEYDPSTLHFEQAERGPLIAATATSWAAVGYTPNLWALESLDTPGCVKVAGLILLDGVHVSADNLAQLNAARVPAASGILINLRFTLLRVTGSDLSFAAAVTYPTLFVDDSLVQGSTCEASSPATMTGGLITTGLPNWWQIEYFGHTGVNSDEDPDKDGVVTWKEYAADTDPTNGVSYFRIAAVSNFPPLKVYFNSSAKRQYTLNWKTNSVSGVWTNVPGQGPRMGAGGPDWMQCTNTVPAGFYRIDVRVP